MIKNKKELWSYLQKNKTASVLNLILITLLVVPYSHTFTHTSEIEPLFWRPNYILMNGELLLIWIPTVFLMVAFQITTKRGWRRAFLFLSLVVSLLLFLIGLATVLFPIQDFGPGIGNLLTPILLPLVTLLLIQEFRKNKA